MKPLSVALRDLHVALGHIEASLVIARDTADELPTVTVDDVPWAEVRQRIDQRLAAALRVLDELRAGVPSDEERGEA